MPTDVQQADLIKRMASIIAHELRNPLAALNNSAYFVKSKLTASGPLDAKVEKHLGIMASEIARADRMIADMLAYSRPLELSKQKAGISELTQKAVGDKASFKRPKADLAVDVDAAKLVTAIEKLVENAVEAVESSGRVTVTVGREKNMACVEVRDTGPGVKAELLPTLFEPFRTGKPKGLGLGLALARKIAEAHGGRAEGGNAPDGGARFRLLIPIDG